MRRHSRLAPLAGVALCAVATCSFPTDKSDEVFVTLAAPSRVVRRGDDMDVYARAWRVVGTDTQQIGNVDFAFYTGSSSIARVEKTCCGYATVTGVNSGTVDILARAVAFEGASQADLVLRVANPLEVDSVRPDTVRYGDTITVYGVGVDSILLASLGGADVFVYPFSAKRDTTGLAQIKFWVPPPARTDSLFYLGNGVFGFAKDTTRVLPFDIYEPNEVAPRNINLEQPPPIPQFPTLLFFNPALAFEPLRREQAEGVDWYRLLQTTSRDLTIILTSPEVAGNFQTFLTDSLGFRMSPDTTHYLGSNAWTFGPGSHACHGLPFEPAQATVDSTIVALKGYPAGKLDAIAIYTKAGRYGLSVINAYVTSKGVNIDSHEEDDYCNAAEAKPDTAQTSLAGSFTIDNPHDVDWFRFRVGGALPTNVNFRVEARPFTAVADTGDIDLFVAKVPNPGDTFFDVRGEATKAGAEDATFLLDPGRYYLIVVDYSGTPTRYVLCFQPGLTSCPLPP